MVINTGAKVFRFHCTACDWEDIRTTGPSLLGRIFSFPPLPSAYKEVQVKDEKCPKCDGPLTKQRMMAQF
jgi:hypothetical protein